jgi:Type II secretory pathway, component PulJ
MRPETTTQLEEPPAEVAVLAAIPSAAQTTRLGEASRWQARLPLQGARFRHACAFTLGELLVSVSVLVLLVLLASQLLNSAATITSLGHKKMDADSQARQVLDRMAVDFAQMIKRSDVDYYLKSSAAPPLRNVLQPGNDQIAFYSAVPGYYPADSYQSPVSLVAYRVNSQNRLERMGKGLRWNAASDADTPVVFIPIPVASPLPDVELPAPTPAPPLPAPAWPQAGNASPDADYEVVGSQVFRFEYCYLLKGGVAPGSGTYGAILTDTPWVAQIAHTAPKGMQDVSAVIVDVAVIDPKSKTLLSNADISALAAQLIDWGDTSCAGCPTPTQWQRTPGLLRAQWQSKLDGITSLPRPAISGIRVYERFFHLSPPTLLTP